RRNQVAAALAVLIFAAGTATMGFALAGHLPIECLYLGIQIVVADIVAIVVFMVKQCKRQGLESPREVIQPRTVDLNDDCIEQIFFHLEHRELFTTCCKVCEQWNRVKMRPSLYKSFVETEGWVEKHPNYYQAYLRLKQLHRTNTLKRL